MAKGFTGDPVAFFETQGRNVKHEIPSIESFADLRKFFAVAGVNEPKAHADDTNFVDRQPNAGVAARFGVLGGVTPLPGRLPFL